MDDIGILLEKARAFHGEVCPGIVMGTRMTIAAMRELGMDPLVHNRDLIVYVEIDRCATDAIQAITGVTLGHRTLKFLDYGKFAATFADASTGRAFRVAALPKKNNGEQDFKEISRQLMTIPESEIFTIEAVEITIPPQDLPGFPTHKDVCSQCGEQILDRREIIRDGRVLCKNCLNGSYYSRKKDHGES